MLHGVMIKDGHYYTMLVGESVFQEFMLHSNCPDPDFELGGVILLYYRKIGILSISAYF